VIADHLTSSSSKEMSREFETEGEVWISFKMADIEDSSVIEIADMNFMVPIPDVTCSDRV
jgi:hypothetical protein